MVATSVPKNQLSAHCFSACCLRFVIAWLYRDKFCEIIVNLACLNVKVNYIYAVIQQGILWYSDERK
jgi:hypothetical protein